jgi:tetratricopeptide (TPR) repeat protein
MAFRFWRRVKIAPGVTLNLSKSGGSLSFGPRGAKFTLGPRGARSTAGIPGTGLSYTTTFSGGSRRGSRRKVEQRSAPPAPAPAVTERDRLSLGFFQRLITPNDEEALVDGCRELVQGDFDRALEHLRKSVHLTDGAFMAGFIALKKDFLDEAVDYLGRARRKHTALGQFFVKYGISATLSIAITPEVTAHVGPNLRGVLLGLAETFQLQDRPKDALECLQQLLRLEPDDVVIKLSLAELLFDARPDDRRVCQKVVQLSESVGNETALHAALLLYKARALRRLELLDAAQATLTDALRRKTERPKELLHALQYERVLTYEALGWQGRARSELERLYAEAPDYEDVAKRLGLNAC